MFHERPAFPTDLQGLGVAPSAARPSAYPGGVALTDRDRMILDIEGRFGRHDALKEEAVRQELGLTPARYYQLLERLLDHPDAVAYAPMLVHRLRRMREAREAAPLLVRGRG